MIFLFLFILISKANIFMYYYVLVLCILYGIHLGFQEMNVCRAVNKHYKSPNNMIDFLLNEQTK